MRNPVKDLNSKMRKIHKVSMECHKHLMDNEGMIESDATQMITEFLHELNDGGVFEMGYKVVIANLKMVFLDEPVGDVVLDMYS